MLKKSQRADNFKLANSKIIKTPYFSLRLAKNQLDSSRFAFVVSKKIDKRATVRNSLKRKVRSCIEEIFDNIENGYDFIFYPSALTKSTERSLVMDEIKRVIAKENLLK